MKLNIKHDDKIIMNTNYMARYHIITLEFHSKSKREKTQPSIIQLSNLHI